jgi:predicted  nucleic acid-binding Zn-ribbon protein
LLFVCVQNRSLQRLDQRIQELHVENVQAKSSFQELHKERVSLNRDRSAKKEEIDEWTKKCTDLQMLKFGRCVDLDELEADADRTKEVSLTCVLLV